MPRHDNPYRNSAPYSQRAADWDRQKTQQETAQFWRDVNRSSTAATPTRASGQARVSRLPKSRSSPSPSSGTAASMPPPAAAISRNPLPTAKLAVAGGLIGGLVGATGMAAGLLQIAPMTPVAGGVVGAIAGAIALPVSVVVLIVLFRLAVILIKAALAVGVVAGVLFALAKLIEGS